MAATPPGPAVAKLTYPASAPRPKGFTCPRHHLKLAVRHVRPAAPDLVVRYLVCPLCKHVRRTEERPHRGD